MLRALLPTLAGAVFVAALPSCTGAAPRHYPMSEQAVLLEVPVVHQDRLYECGMAAVSALCAYYAIAPEPQAAADLAALAEAQAGLSGGEVRAYLEALEFEVLLFRGTLDHSATGALRQIDAGRPRLVMISFDDGVNHHYCLLVGYDPGMDAVYLLDPRRGLVMLPTTHYAQLWSASANFSLIAVPADAADAIL
jgi:ABC-type bacteriocin/lantibiotic exporter with double-glycine peptidase domain